MGRLNSATPEQRVLIRKLIEAAGKLPPVTDNEAYWEYQNTVMEPIREAIRNCKGEKVG
jgi:hypothetical protein